MANAAGLVDWAEFTDQYGMTWSYLEAISIALLDYTIEELNKQHDENSDVR